MPDNVLVVDDSPTILKLVQLTLAKAGYRVLTASSARGAAQIAREEAPALVLIDDRLPGSGDDDPCALMSDDATLGNVPTVLMSAQSEGPGRLAGLRNVVDRISKPFSPEALVTVVAGTLAKRAAELANGTPAEVRVDLDALTEEPPVPAAEPVLEGAALAGDLALVAVADVLLLLQDQNQSGVLTLAHDAGRLEIHYRAGRIDFAGARGVPDEFLLGRFLVEAGLVSRPVLDAVLEERKEAQSHELLGAELVRRELIDLPGLRRAMSLQTSALVYEGLRWGDGRFWFRATTEQPAPVEEAALALPVDALIMEALRRIDEWRLIERELGNFDAVFVRNEEKMGTMGPERLLGEELAILELVNGKHTVRDIIQLSQMGSFEVTQVLFRLLRSKLVRRRVPPLAV